MEYLSKFLFNKISRRLKVNNFLFMKDDPAYEGYMIGEFTYGKPLIKTWGEGGRLEIGKFCSIAEDVMFILGGEHRSDWITTYPFNLIFPEFSWIKGHPSTKGDIFIGNDVWIGQGATILSGVFVGDGAVIGAKSVVTKAVNPYEIVAGNPARHIRYRFDEKIVNFLLNVKWWEWDLNKIRENINLLMGGDVDKFIDVFGK
jgi:virginiamycin A acetyltransferase